MHMQARLAKEARDEAEVAVAKEPSHDLGHHLIGRHGLYLHLNMPVMMPLLIWWGSAMSGQAGT